MARDDESVAREQIRSMEQTRKQIMRVLAELDQTMAKSKELLKRLEVDRLTRAKPKPRDPK